MKCSMRNKALLVFMVEIFLLMGCNYMSFVDENADFEKQIDKDIQEKKFFTLSDIAEFELHEDMLAYWLVLNNRKPFISTDEEYQKFYWNEYHWRLGSLTEQYRADYFMIVDMDGDGADEIVLGCSPETTQILHYEDGDVYSYQFVFRGMKRIHSNGVYEGSGGAASTFYFRLTKLDKYGYEEEMLAGMDGDYYEIGQKESSYEEFCRYVDSIESVALAECMDVKGDMLDQWLLGNLSEQELALVKRIPVENMLENETDYQEHRQVVQSYAAVLMGEEDVIYVTRDTSREGLSWIYFSIVDMDGDGVDELVFIGNHDIVQILHYEKENTYCYQLLLNKFEIPMIMTDGMFQTSSSPSGYARIVSFEEDGCQMEPVEGYEEDGHERIRYYYYSEEAIARWLEQGP